MSLAHKKHSPHKLIRDISIVVISVAVAVLLVKTGVFDSIFSFTKELKILSIFIAGLFFTSIFTTPLAIVALGELSLSTPLLMVAFVGALGAVIGDIIIFLFVRDSLAEDIEEILEKHPMKRLRHIFRFRIFRFLTPLLGAIVIASPLPDELGLAMMGLSRVRMNFFIPVSFIMNFIGIVLIGLVALSIS